MCSVIMKLPCKYTIFYYSFTIALFIYHQHKFLFCLHQTIRHTIIIGKSAFLRILYNSDFVFIVRDQKKNNTILVSILIKGLHEPIKHCIIILDLYQKGINHKQNTFFSMADRLTMTALTGQTRCPAVEFRSQDGHFRGPVCLGF